MHRADLLAALARALPAERLHLGRRLAGFEDRGDRVEAQFDGGERIEAPALIGADGIHSGVRRALFGPERPRFTGCVAYRGLVDADTGRCRRVALRDARMAAGATDWSFRAVAWIYVHDAATPAGARSRS